MKEQIGYKVVRKLYEDSYCSAIIRYMGTTMYKRNEWVKAGWNWLKKKDEAIPDGYELTYFKKESNAIKFMINTIGASNLGMAVFKCKVRGIVKLPPHKFVIGGYVDWKDRCEDMDWPEETGMAKEIMLLEKITEINHE